MARCVITGIADGSGGAVVSSCAVHARNTPCPEDGKPANPAPVHAFDADRDVAIRAWEARTGRQRPLVIHAALGNPTGHVVAAKVAACPCGAEVILS